MHARHGGGQYRDAATELTRPYPLARETALSRAELAATCRSVGLSASLEIDGQLPVLDEGVGLSACANASGSSAGTSRRDPADVDGLTWIRVTPRA
jgi:hypothetical protein